MDAIYNDQTVGAMPEEQSPEELAQLQRLARLDALGQALTAKRKTAINGRAQSGIESVWLEDEDAYDGIDDANRHQEASGRTRFNKPSSTSGTLVEAPKPDVTRSVILPNITGPYVDIWAASISDMLLPSDDWPFGLDPTPMPELVSMVEQLEQMAPDQPVQIPGQQLTPAAEAVKRATAEMDKAKKCAEKAETRIKDWLTECQWHGEVRRMLDDAARIGTGVLKGPFPVKRKQNVWQKRPDGVQELIVNEEIKPASRRIDPWNCYPDPSCGEDIHNGSYFWERDDITCKTLQDLRGTPDYIDSQIEACLEEGPIKAIAPAEQRKAETRVSEDTPFEVWYYTGAVEREDLEAAGCDCSEVEGKYVAIPAILTMVNDRVIRASLNPLDNGKFPYDFMVCRKRAGMPWGQGIARQIRPSQRIITACTRALMENAGLSARPMLAVLRKVLEPVDGNWNLYGGKVFTVKADADVAEAKHAIQAITIDSRQVELLNIIQFALKMAEDITGMPLILQGQQGKAPDTVGGLQILNQNASTTRRRVARMFDYSVIEPHVTRYYEWLQQYGEDEEEKGLFVVDARASTVLVERDIQSQELAQMGGLVTNPVFGKDPKKWINEVLRARRIDPEKLDYDDEEWRQIVENMAKGPQDPRLAVAQFKAQVDERIKQMELGFEQQENAKDRALEMWLAQLEDSGQKAISLDDVRAKLADTTIKTRAQIALSRESGARQMLKPPTEPAGRAPAGQAFQR